MALRHVGCRLGLRGSRQAAWACSEHLLTFLSPFRLPPSHLARPQVQFSVLKTLKTQSKALAAVSARAGARGAVARGLGHILLLGSHCAWRSAALRDAPACQPAAL